MYTMSGVRLLGWLLTWWGYSMSPLSSVCRGQQETCMRVYEPPSTDTHRQRHWLPCYCRRKWVLLESGCGGDKAEKLLQVPLLFTTARASSSQTIVLHAVISGLISWKLSKHTFQFESRTKRKTCDPVSFCCAAMFLSHYNSIN